MEKIYNLLYRLRIIKRWGTSINIISEDVSQHSFYVAVITHILCMIVTDIFGREIDASRSVVYALYHEIHEVYTAHIVSPIKNRDLNAKLCYGNIKLSYRNRIINLLPLELRLDFSKVFIFNENDNMLKEIVEEADLIDAYCKCKFEYMNGNRDFKYKLEMYEGKIRNLRQEKDYINYFFDNMIDFGDLEIYY